MLHLQGIEFMYSFVKPTLALSRGRSKSFQDITFNISSMFLRVRLLLEYQVMGGGHSYTASLFPERDMT